ncbi:DUF2721 domain-containing protein [Cyanobium sp. Alchichica 3B3-8F6]|uniref:DUF2721 domain-containing protein n=1 Tax=Synechococcales TaxID=1890424 RepID=UPI000B982E1D|nr:MULTISPECIES: DUF2721 domain-containing protein [Synechococcales]MCP9882037.1 DUF2721 domain-containing protein [Cyanobium sp. Alchichica 3B3-8F6]MCP9941204.1 DUF2721 domain-containing protein [Cyanobium sp. ATX 6E8]
MPSADLARAIQLSLAPVFLLASMSGLLMVLTNRLGRLVDRARELKRQERDSDLEMGRDLRQELQGQKRRMGLLMKAIEFGSVTMLLVALVVAIVFISVVAQLDLALMVAPLFVLAMVCLMVAVSLLLRELQLATAQLRRTF